MITLLYGTRPEAIKLGPVAAELRSLGTPFRVVCTGQHTDLLKGTPAEHDLFGSSSLNLPSKGNVLQWLAQAERALRFQPDDFVVVQGDTMSALAGARAAAGARLPLAHVEAGVRSHCHSDPWPEELFRIEIDSLSDYFYTPTTTAYANLIAEGHAQHVLLTGNTCVSALHRYATGESAPPQAHLYITLHRRELLQSPVLPALLQRLSQEAAARSQFTFIWPIHPAMQARALDWISKPLPSNLHLRPPLPYRAAVELLRTAQGVLTDSGGVAEEAAVFGVPAIHLRQHTDRPEAVEAGVARAIPPTPAGLAEGIQALCASTLPRTPSGVYGDRSAAFQIALHLTRLGAP